MTIPCDLSPPFLLTGVGWDEKVEELGQVLISLSTFWKEETLSPVGAPLSALWTGIAAYLALGLTHNSRIWESLLQCYYIVSFCNC